MQRLAVDVGVDAAGGDDRRQGRGEAQTVLRVGEIERLDAEPVARQHDAAAVALPDREREHAVEALDTARAPGVIGLDDDLGVAFGEEAIALRFERAPQVAEIVDAAVEHDGEAERRIEHRLLAGRREIEDAQPAVAERDATLGEEAARVRAAWRERRRHLLECR